MQYRQEIRTRLFSSSIVFFLNRALNSLFSTAIARNTPVHRANDAGQSHLATFDYSLSIARVHRRDRTSFCAHRATFAAATRCNLTQVTQRTPEHTANVSLKNCATTTNTTQAQADKRHTRLFRHQTARLTVSSSRLANRDHAPPTSIKPPTKRSTHESQPLTALVSSCASGDALSRADFTRCRLGASGGDAARDSTL
jgi:hypothetical protein